MEPVVKGLGAQPGEVGEEEDFAVWPQAGPP